MRSITRLPISTLGLALAVHLSADTQVSRGLVNRESASAYRTIYSGSHALLLGAQYNSAAWPPLRSIGHELQALRAALESHGFQVLVPPAAAMTGSRIRQEVLSFISRYGLASDNRVLIVFAGHGYTREHADRERGYLVPSDAPDPATDTAGFVYSAISMDEVQSWAKMIESKHGLFVFDSCFSGSIFRTRGAPAPKYLSAQLAQPVRQFLTAGSASETVPAESAFLPLLVRGLEGEADGDCDGFVTATELYSWISRSIAGYDVGQTPQFGKIRDPQLDRGEFLFPLPQPRAECATRTASSDAAQRLEEEFWAAIVGSSEPALFRHYLARVQEGAFAGRYTAAAEARLKELAAPPRSGGFGLGRLRAKAPAVFDTRAAQSRLRRNLAQLIATSAPPDEGLSVELELLRPASGTQASDRTEPQTLKAGDRVRFKATNLGASPVYLVLFFVNSAGVVTRVSWETQDGKRPLEPQKGIETAPLPVTDDSVGTEEMFLIASDTLADVERHFNQAISGAAPIADKPARRHVAKVVSWFTSVRPVR